MNIYSVKLAAVTGPRARRSSGHNGDQLTLPLPRVTPAVGKRGLPSGTISAEVIKE